MIHLRTFPRFWGLLAVDSATESTATVFRELTAAELADVDDFLPVVQDIADTFHANVEEDGREQTISDLAAHLATVTEVQRWSITLGAIELAAAAPTNFASRLGLVRAITYVFGMSVRLIGRGHAVADLIALLASLSEEQRWSVLLDAIELVRPTS